MAEVWTIGWPTSEDGYHLYPEAFPSRQAAISELVYLNAARLLRGDDDFLVLIDRLLVVNKRTPFVYAME